MCNTTARLKRDPVVARGMTHIHCLIPEVPNESPHVWPNPILLQKLYASFPIYHVKSLCEINEYPVKWGLLNVRMLLSQLCIDNSHARSPPVMVMAAMEAVVKNNSFKTVIHHMLNDFPHRFEQTNPMISR